MKIVKTKDRTPQLIDKLLKVWENSVRATHKFLSNEEILEIKKYVPQALNDIAHLIIDTDENENPIAFIGIEGNKLEMLFIASEYRGKGIGTKLIETMLKLLKNKGYKKTSLAVQKDNYAVKMYKKVGFKIINENEQEYIMVCDL